MKNKQLIQRSIDTSGTSDMALVTVPRDCVLDYVDFAGGFIAEGAPGSVTGSIRVGRGGRASLEDSDGGKMLACVAASIRSTTGAGATDNGLTLNKFCPISIPLSGGEILYCTAETNAGGRTFAVVILCFSYS